MGAKCSIWAWRVGAPRIDRKQPMVLLTLLAIADIANDRTGKLWASHQYIADLGHLSPRSVRSAVSTLEELGLIRTESQMGAADVIWLCLTAVTIFERGPEPDEEQTVWGSRRPRKPGQHAPHHPGAGEGETPARTPAGGADKPREPKNGTLVPVGTDARGSRLADDWEPDLHAATMIGLTHDQAAAEGERFKDYWLGAPGQKGRKADWPATWRNWCRRALEEKYGGRGSPASPRSPDRGADQHSARVETMVDGARQALDRRRRWSLGG